MYNKSILANLFLFILLFLFGIRVIIRKRFSLGWLGKYKGKKAVAMGLFAILVGLGFLLGLLI